MLMGRWKPFKQYIKEQRHYFANKGLSSQGYGFPSSHVWMWELDYKESWVLKNWCFWTVVLEKTLESLLCDSVCVHRFTRVQLFATPWTVAHQVALSVGFSKQKNTAVGCYFLLQGIFPTRGSSISCISCILGGFSTHWATWEAPFSVSAYL